MADKKKILIVDDDFEIALFLRSTLEIMWPDFEVVNVPSAEEAMLEMRPPADLIISDLNLPGMSGFDFIARLRRRTPDIPIILITEERSPRQLEQARSLGLAGFFLKPIQVEDLARVVRQILYGEANPAEELSVAGRSVPAGVARRLNLLRVDTGAHYAMLVDVNGDCVVADGQIRDLASDQVAHLLAQGLSNSLELARALKAPQPFTINYQAGALHDLYAANVGANYIVALIFDSQRGRTQIGAVWVYARRAVKDLLEMLTDMEIAPSGAPKEAVAMPSQDEVPPPEVDLSSAETETVTIEEEPLVLEEEATPFKDQSPEEETLDSEEAIEASLPEEEPIPVSDEVNAFWDSVFSEEVVAEEDGFGGLTWEEAQARGLLPTNFGE